MEVVVRALCAPILSLLEFTSVGPAAGSVAAGIQASLYAGVVPAGGTFATLQSMAMTAGAIGARSAAPVVAVSAAAAAVVGWAVSALSRT
jgi:hypothetical protein